MMGDRSLSQLKNDTVYMDIPMLEEVWLVGQTEERRTMGWRVHELTQVGELFPGPRDKISNTCQLAHLPLPIEILLRPNCHF
jgi:hypothetical protein